MECHLPYLCLQCSHHIFIFRRRLDLVSYPMIRPRNRQKLDILINDALLENVIHSIQCAGPRNGFMKIKLKLLKPYYLYGRTLVDNWKFQKLPLLNLINYQMTTQLKHLKNLGSLNVMFKELEVVNSQWELLSRHLTTIIPMRPKLSLTVAVLALASVDPSLKPTILILRNSYVLYLSTMPMELSTEMEPSPRPLN